MGLIRRKPLNRRGLHPTGVDYDSHQRETLYHEVKQERPLHTDELDGAGNSQSFVPIAPEPQNDEEGEAELLQEKKIKAKFISVRRQGVRQRWKHTGHDDKDGLIHRSRRYRGFVGGKMAFKGEQVETAKLDEVARLEAELAPLGRNVPWRQRMVGLYKMQGKSLRGLAWSRYETGDR